MKAKVTRVFSFDDEQIQKVMSDYFGEEYTAADVETILDNLDASEVQAYGSCHFIMRHDVEVKK